MSGRKLRELAPALAQAQARFRDWRRKRKPRARIPEPLWGLAVRLASAQGVCRTASALGLDYYSLKKRLVAANGPPVATVPTFVELSAPRASEKQCVLGQFKGVRPHCRQRVLTGAVENPVEQPNHDVVREHFQVAVAQRRLIAITARS